MGEEQDAASVSDTSLGGAPSEITLNNLKLLVGQDDFEGSGSSHKNHFATTPAPPTRQILTHESGFVLELIQRGSREALSPPC